MFRPRCLRKYWHAGRRGRPTADADLQMSSTTASTPSMSLDSLDTDALVHVISMLASAEDLARLDCVSKLFHQPPPPPHSLVEQALWKRSGKEMPAAGKAPPQGHANWTQKLLRDERWARPRNPNRTVSGGHCHTAFVDQSGLVHVVGCELGGPNEEGDFPDEAAYWTGTSTDGPDGEDVDCEQAFAEGTYMELCPPEDAALGVLGLGSAIHRTLEPTIVRSIAHVRIVSISCPFSHALALSEDGQVFSWGSGGNALGLGEATAATSSVSEPRIVGTCSARTAGVMAHDLTFPPPGCRVVCISAGDGQSWAALDDGRCFSWGNSAGCGRTGHGTEGIVARPRQIEEFHPAPTAPAIVAVAAGTHHSLVLSSLGAVFACGSADYLGLGGAEGEDQLEPRHVSALQERVVSITVGTEHSAAVTEAGSVFTWGYDDGGRLGYSTDVAGNMDRPFVLLPRRVDALASKSVWSVSTKSHNAAFMFVLCDGGEVYSLGRQARQRGCGPQWRGLCLRRATLRDVGAAAGPQAAARARGVRRRVQGARGGVRRPRLRLGHRRCGRDAAAGCATRSVSGPLSARSRQDVAAAPDAVRAGTRECAGCATGPESALACGRAEVRSQKKGRALSSRRVSFLGVGAYFSARLAPS